MPKKAWKTHQETTLAQGQESRLAELIQREKSMGTLDNTSSDILDNVAAPVFALKVSSSGKITYCAWNTCAERISGILREDVLGKSAIELHPGRYGRVAHQHHERAARLGETMSYEIKLPLNSEIRSVKTTLTPTLDDAGKVVELVGTSIDLTEELQQQRALIKTESESNALAKEMEHFLTMTAHDLRSPMQYVESIARTLKEDFQDLGDGKLELIEKLEKIGVEASVLISEVLSYARATNVIEKNKRFNLDELCSSIFAVLDPDGIHDLSSSKRAIFGDEVALQVVLHNLLNHAIKNAGRDRVMVAVDFEAASPEQLRFLIRDDGRALDDPAIAFLDSGEFLRESGFGLLGVKRLLNSRGCDIGAMAVPGEDGSLIHFTFPGRVVRWSEEEQNAAANGA